MCVLKDVRHCESHRTALTACSGSGIDYPGKSPCINVFQMSVCLCDLLEVPVTYSNFSVLNVTAALYLPALRKNFNGCYQRIICAVLTFAHYTISRCNVISLINYHSLLEPALRMF